MDEFYLSKKWKKKRSIILRRDGYMCQISKRYGKLVSADVVHHIFPLDEYPEYAFCDWNLVSLSRAAHNKLHDRTTNKLTDVGIDLMVKTAIKRGIVLY